MSNHLIIGLGGTGGKVIRELRKRIYEEYRTNDPKNGVFIDYIYVDSSPADLNDRSKWKVLGKSVHLADAQKVNINGINTSILDNINMYPGLECFINSSDRDLIKRHMGQLIAQGIGGQRRRLGRMLIANNLANTEDSGNFNHVLHGAVNRLQQNSGDNNVIFHICAGLAGGTGSGSIIDVIAQIRKKYPYEQDTKSFKMRLFLYVPERNMVYADHDNGFYQANGYAALQELNAISVGKYFPLDVTGEKDIYTHEVRRLMQGQEAFEVAYLYTNVNEKGKVLDLNDALPRSVADFMFQSIVAVGENGDASKMARLVGCENDGAGPEQDKSGDRNRSRKFMSFGITRIEYPETEIEELITYRYAIQATRQLTYNLWQEGIGFGDCSIEEVGVGFASEIKDLSNREGLKLSNSYLTLGKPIVESPATKNWREFDKTWENRTQQFVGIVQKQYEKKQWLPQFVILVEDYYNNSFRAHGVKKFFEIQQQERKGYARHIRRHIETGLFNQWAAGTKSIIEIEKYASILRADCADRIAAFDEQIAKQKTKMAECSENMRIANLEWSNVGWLKDALTNASSRIFQKYRTESCNYYVAETRIESYLYAKTLLQEIIMEIGNMIEGVQAMKNELNAILEDVVRQAGSKCQINAPVNESIIKKYNPEKVHELAKEYERNKDFQLNNAQQIRNQMIARLGEDGEHTFASLYSVTNREMATDIILNICTTNARSAMEDTAKNDPLKRMLGVNILEKLYNDLNTDEQMEKFVDKAVNFAKSYIQLNPTETAMGINGNAGMMSMVQLILPKAENDQQNDFRKRLIDAFKLKASGFTEKEDVSITDKPNQIVVICANSGFPLRYVLNLQVLKEKYDQLNVDDTKELNRMVLHTESFENPLPSLFELTSNQIREMAKKPLLLAFALDLIQSKTNNKTGAKFFALGVADEMLNDYNWEELGKDFNECLDRLAGDFSLYNQLKLQVDKELLNRTRNNEQKSELRQAIGKVVREIILPSVCESDDADPTYKAYRNLAKQIIEEKLKDF